MATNVDFFLSGQLPFFKMSSRGASGVLVSETKSGKNHLLKNCPFWSLLSLLSTLLCAFTSNRTLIECQKHLNRRLFSWLHCCCFWMLLFFFWIGSFSLVDLSRITLSQRKVGLQKFVLLFLFWNMLPFSFCPKTSAVVTSIICGSADCRASTGRRPTDDVQQRRARHNITKRWTHRSPTST